MNENLLTDCRDHIQQVEVAVIPVSPMQYRTEDTRVRSAKAAYRFAHSTSLHVKHNGWSHGHPYLLKTC